MLRRNIGYEMGKWNDSFQKELARSGVEIRNHQSFSASVCFW